MRLLILGKTGQVATSLEELCAAGTIEAKIAGRDSCDITDRESVYGLIEDYQPDAVINAAAYTAVDMAETDQDAAYAVNADGAGIVASASAQFDIPILHISTDYVFAGEKQTPYVETDQTDPQGIYGASKLAGEKLVATKNPQHLILRTAWVYSSIGNNFVKTMLRLAGERDELNVVADQIGNPTSAHEIAVALIEAARKIVLSKSDNQFGVFNFCGPQSMSWADFARLIFDISRATGGPSALVNDITSAEYPTKAKRPANSVLNSEKFSKVFGVKHVDTEIALKRCVSDLVGNPS